MPKEFIVAIELGSSKMRGIAGHKNLDGSITVLTAVEENASACIRKGVVYNIDKTCQCLTSIIKKMKTTLKQDITQVYVGVGGRSIRSMKNVIVKDLPNSTRISQEMINELMDMNRNMSYPDQEILDAVTQEYKIDNQYQIDPVGIQCNHLEGIFLNILWRKNFYNNINTCFENAHIQIAEMYLAPLALADSVLTDNEKRSGCILVDLGADTTTVSVYFKNILRHLSVIPLGGNNITKDLTFLQIEEQDAEELKLKYAKAYTNTNKIDPTQTYPIDEERQVESRKLIEIVEARVEEIVENVWAQIPNEHTDKLMGGIILTGGGSNMPEIAHVFKTYTHIDKVRIAKFVTEAVTSNDPKITNHNGTMNTILGLLAKGDMNCAGPEIDNNLFGPNNDPSPLSTDTKATGKGVVQTAAEKEEARKKREEEDRRREEEERIKAEEERERLAKERKEKSILGRAFKGFKKFMSDTLTEET